MAQPKTTLTDEWANLYLPGGWLGRYVTWACKTTHAPPIFHLLCGISYAGFELARRGWWLDGVAGGFSQKAPTAWLALMAESGAGKSASLSRLRAFDAACQKQTPMMLLDSRVEGTSLVTVRGSYAGVFAELEKRLYSDLRGGERTVAMLVNDEMHVVLEMARRDPQFGSHFLELHDQNDMVFHQRGIQKEEDGDRRGKLPATALSALFVSTKEQINDIFDERLLHGGFASRFLWFYPPRDQWQFWPVEPGRHEEEMTSVASAFVAWLEAVCDRDQGSARIVLPDGGDVFDAHVAWSMELHERHPYGSPNRVLYVPRMAQATGILASIISTLTATPSSTPISVDLESYQLARNIVTEAYNSLPTLIELASPRAVQEDREAVEFVRSAGIRGVIKEDLIMSLKKTAPAIQATLRSMAEVGWIVCLNVRTGRKGKPRQRFFAPEFAPPPELRIGAGGGSDVEAIMEDVLLEWVSGSPAEVILARRTPSAVN